MKLPDITARREVQDLVRRALREDVGPGDVTSGAVVRVGERAQAFVVSHGKYVVSGGGLAALVFRASRRDLAVRQLVRDGRAVSSGARVLEVRGNARGILAAERVALNFLQHMTGVATLTRRFVEKAGLRRGVRILDTRKTTPGLRILEKYAVLCGGGSNHRRGLHDQVLIKDNHLVLWRRRGRENLADAVRAARRACPGLPVEIEVRTERELKDVLAGSPDWVLLDNMPPDRIRRCVKICRGRCQLEASGGINLNNIEAFARTGVDAISIGAITHSAPAADLSLEFED
ncbi:MAG: carboxylating nicotinate-nucleotide diphosphorylase [Verrucomicrobiota bacterium]